MTKNDTSIPVITIDGPSGTGKGTVCHLVAQHLGWHILDSGAIYRVLAYAATLQGVDVNNEEKLAQLAQVMNVRFVPAEDGVPQVFLNGEDVSAAIRTEENSKLTSPISAFPKVRRALVQSQQNFRQMPGLVTDGRDMGTVIFPDAQLKLYLTASSTERAKRRYKQLLNQGINANLAQVLDELEQRDARDQARQVSPLKPAEDAVIIDTSALSIDEVVRQIMTLAKVRFKGININA